MGLGGPRQRMVLAVLLASPNRVVSQDALIEAVWAGEPPEAAKTTLHSYVSHLRGCWEARSCREGDGYRVVVADEQLDALRFERLVSEGRRQLEADPGVPSACSRKLWGCGEVCPTGTWAGAGAFSRGRPTGRAACGGCGEPDRG